MRPIKNLDMDSMTMVFRVGDRIVFEAERVNGQITITKMGKAP